METHILVSIPQAVWIACNETYEDAVRFVEKFQYRKRYGLHAIRFIKKLRFSG